MSIQLRPQQVLSLTALRPDQWEIFHAKNHVADPSYRNVATQPKADRALQDWFYQNLL